MSNPTDYSTLNRSISLRVEPARTFIAITTPSDLRSWYADRVELEPHLGGEFLFTDPTVQDGVTVAVITKWEPEGIAFARDFRGIPTETFWSAKSDPEGSRLTWTQHMPGNASAYAYFTAEDLSKVAMYNLRSYLETGQPAIGPTAMGAGIVRLQVTVQGPASDVWASLTVPAEMDKFLSSKAEVDLRVDGRYSYGWTEEGQEAGPAKLLEIEEGHRVKHDWFFPDEPDTQVEWLVEGGDGFTVVTLTHSGFGDYDNLPSYGNGWKAFLLALKSKVEGRDLVQ